MRPFFPSLGVENRDGVYIFAGQLLDPDLAEEQRYQGQLNPCEADGDTVAVPGIARVDDRQPAHLQGRLEPGDELHVAVY